MSQATRILGALAVGLLFGILSARYGSVWVENVIAVAEPIGALWLDALRMTIIPLIVSLLVTGIATSAEAVRASRLAFRAVLLFLAVLWSGAILSAFLTPLLLRLWPMPVEAAGKLKAALSSSTEKLGEIPTVGQFLSSIV